MQESAFDSIASKYRSLIFDCDGVVMDSNKVKTRAFYNAAIPYGEAAANALVSYHLRNGGISRFRKFEYFLEHIVPPDISGPTLDELLAAYAADSRNGLLNCDIVDGLRALRAQFHEAIWFIVSGGEQTELREIFNARSLTELFDGGVYGSPDTKEQILCRLIEEKKIQHPALFLGDSRYDHQAARASGLEFLFVNAWTDFNEWSGYCTDHKIASVASLTCLLEPGMA